MKFCVIVNPYFDSEDYLYQAKRIKEEFNLRSIECDILNNKNFLARIEDGNISKKLQDYTAIIFWDKDKYLLEMLDRAGFKIFNSKDAIEVCDDKMMTYIALTKNAIRMPKTLPGLLCFTKNAHISNETINEIENTFKYPLIIKESFGSLGKSVYLIQNRDELASKLEEVKCVPHLIQEYIETSKGKDIRVIAIGGKAIGAMMRISNGDFRSNIGAGGSGIKVELDDEIIKISNNIAQALGLDYCGIDLLLDKDGYSVCEVNSNAFFKTFEKATNINVASKYVDYIMSKLN